MTATKAPTQAHITPPSVDLVTTVANIMPPSAPIIVGVNNNFDNCSDVSGPTNIDISESFRNDKNVDNKILTWNTSIMQERKCLHNLALALSIYFKKEADYNLHQDLLISKFKMNMSTEDKLVISTNVNAFKDKRNITEQIIKTKHNMLIKQIDLKIDKIRRYMFPSNAEKKNINASGRRTFNCNEDYNKHIEEIVKKRILEHDENVAINLERATKAQKRLDMLGPAEFPDAETDEEFLDDHSKSDNTVTSSLLNGIEDMGNPARINRVIKDDDVDDSGGNAVDNAVVVPSDANLKTDKAKDDQDTLMCMESDDDDDGGEKESETNSVVDMRKVEPATMKFIQKVERTQEWADLMETCHERFASDETLKQPTHYSQCSNKSIKCLTDMCKEDKYFIWMTPSTYVRNKSHVDKLVHKRLIISEKRMIVAVNLGIDAERVDVPGEIVSSVLQYKKL
jgi:hypothetical protein